MGKFLGKAATTQTAFVIGFVKHVVNRLALDDRFALFDLTAFGKRRAVNLDKSCDIGAVFGYGSVEFDVFVHLRTEDFFGDKYFVCSNYFNRALSFFVRISNNELRPSA